LQETVYTGLAESSDPSALCSQPRALRPPVRW